MCRRIEDVHRQRSSGSLPKPHAEIENRHSVQIIEDAPVCTLVGKMTKEADFAGGGFNGERDGGCARGDESVDHDRQMQTMCLQNRTGHRRDFVTASTSEPFPGISALMQGDSTRDNLLLATQTFVV